MGKGSDYGDALATAAARQRAQTIETMKPNLTDDTGNNSYALPSRFQLAMIAAAIQRTNPADAVQHALALWQESGVALEAAAFDGLKLPKFPATLDDFLRLVVCAKTSADGTKRLRDFYMAEHARPLFFRGKLSAEDRAHAERQAADEIAAWKTGQIPDAERSFDAEKWKRLAVRYAAWWKTQVSTKARESALKRTKKPTSSPITKKNR